LQEAILVVQALGLTPIVLNHEGEKDRKLCLQLVEMMTIPPLFIDGLNAFEVKKIIGLSVFNLSSRFHGCVSSLSQGVPSLATSWSHKYEQLYCYYECSELLVDMTGETGQLEHKMAQLLAQREEVSTNLHNRADAHKETIEQMWAAVFKRLK
jgi:polysaccharide pyruvyl transferase WcaK-like protein